MINFVESGQSSSFETIDPWPSGKFWVRVPLVQGPVVASEPPAALPPGTLPRTAEMWRAEALKLRGALEERKMLNQCLRQEVLTGAEWCFFFFFNLEIPMIVVGQFRWFRCGWNHWIGECSPESPMAPWPHLKWEHSDGASGEDF